MGNLLFTQANLWPTLGSALPVAFGDEAYGLSDELHKSTRGHTGAALCWIPCVPDSVFLRMPFYEFVEITGGPFPIWEGICVFARSLKAGWPYNTAV